MWSEFKAKSSRDQAKTNEFQASNYESAFKKIQLKYVAVKIRGKETDKGQSD